MSRIATTAGSLCLAAFCTFGFLASFEPGVHPAWKVGYGVAVAVLLGIAVRPWILPAHKDETNR